MKKTLYFAILLILVLCLTSCGSTENTSSNNNTLPDHISKYVTSAPAVTAEMNNADFWIQKCDDADAVLMNHKEIDAINKDNEPEFEINKNTTITLSSIKSIIDGSYVKALLNGYTVPENSSDYYADGNPISESYWNALKENMHISSVQKKVTVDFGFTVKHTDVKSAPTADFLSDSKEDKHYDMNAVAECAPYEPVAVLHESKDSKWYYIAAYGYAGWVPVDNIAVCSSRDDWISAQNSEEYLIVTGREIRLAYDPYDPDSSGQLIPMGTKLTLVKPEDAPSDFNGRTSYNSYIVKVPDRLANGRLDYKYTLVPVSDDVHIGYLPYTRENIIGQAFKRLGDRYGWAGMYSANDCSGITREIYSCFGFEFPRNGKAQIRMKSMQSIDVSKKTDEEKVEALRQLPAGSLLYFPGHLMIYLGMNDDTPYVISAVGNMATSDMAEGESIAVNSVIINSLSDTTRKTGKTWLNCITNILTCEQK